MLNAIGEEPYILTHGTDRDAASIILVMVSVEEEADLKKKTAADPVVIKIANKRFIALPLESGAAAGFIDQKYFDSVKNRWTSTIALARYRK